VRQAGACLSIGEQNRKFYLAYGAREERIFSAPYSVDNYRFAEAGEIGRQRRTERLRSLGLDPELPVVLFAAKLHPRKRPLDLLEAVERLERPCNVIYVGDGELGDDLRRRAERLPTVKIVGFVNQSEMGEWYGMAELFVLPSEHEPWGLAVNEAMAAGTVPIASDSVGCVPDLVTPGTGRVFPTGDVAALAAVLEELLSSADERTELARRARDRVSAYDIAATARGIEQGALAAVADGRCE